MVLQFASLPVEFPLRNKNFLKAYQAGMFGKDVLWSLREHQGEFLLRSEVTALRLGEILFVTVPGESCRAAHSPDRGANGLRSIQQTQDARQTSAASSAGPKSPPPSDCSTDVSGDG